jgi:hypothetical protein
LKQLTASLEQPQRTKANARRTTPPNTANRHDRNGAPMATWKKSPPELIAAFDAALAPLLAPKPLAERRQMFGYPCAFVNGHMAVGLHENRLIARVPEEADARPCIILGRRMKSYAALGFDEIMAKGEMARWVQRAVAFTGTMPPKASKAKPLKAIKAATTKPAAPPQPARKKPAAKTKASAPSPRRAPR